MFVAVWSHVSSACDMHAACVLHMCGAELVTDLYYVYYNISINLIYSKINM